MLLLPRMKVTKHILFRLLFLFAVLFCLGLEAYSYYNSPICNIELSSERNCEENNVFSSTDTLEDDHINQAYKPFYLDDQNVLIPILNDEFLLQYFSFSSWQPPKYS